MTSLRERYSGLLGLGAILLVGAGWGDSQTGSLNPVGVPQAPNYSRTVNIGESFDGESRPAYARPETQEGDSSKQQSPITYEILNLRNEPNPFDGRTVIRFYLPVEAVADLTIRPVDGETIATLLRRSRLRAGQQELEFSGRGLASGIYVCTLRLHKVNATSDPFERDFSTCHMMLLK